ncbi:Los1p [Sugiyamaella lignohabitans]|uniref:Exportin-T n=1 Tax=Sugiyamaella lignohabitans TaxID=796027 RepID=A0A167C7Y1_9ASCO|nr:Los1p [Sugiyamaella lignohabitans]ANB11334.1 Los1p [Sugiyamaella lignohabitans]
MSSENPAPLEPFHMRNKLAQTMAYLFITSYANEWPSFFDDLLGIAINPISNARGVDMYLRILKVIHEEIGDHLILRTPEETKRNNVLKDLVRERAMTKLASSWMNILEYYSNNDPATNNDNNTTSNSINDNNNSINSIGINSTNNNSNINSKENLYDSILTSALNVIGGWVSWIEITLIVNPPYLSLIFNQLGRPSQRLAACDALAEIIAKKMQPSHKLELIGLLNLTTVLAELNKTSKGSTDPEFEERVAKLSNIVGLELVHIADGTTTVTSGAACSQQDMDKAEQLMVDLLPTILEFLSNEYDDTSVQVLPCLNEYLQFIRREAKKERSTAGGTDSSLSTQRLEIVSVMLRKIILKMEYDDSTEWSGGEDESEGEFLELRGKLKVLQDQIAGIDADLFTDGMASIINTCLESANNKKWQEVELGLYELSAFGDSIRNGSIKSSRAEQTFFDLFSKMVHSDVVTINHPSIQLWYMELINRHSKFFTPQQPQLLSKALEVFVSPLGVHNPNIKVRVRSWYLFHRFLKTVKSLVGDISQQVFSSLAPLLVVRAELPSSDNDSEMSADSASDSVFDAQLYLFELLGLLFANADDNQARTPTQQLLQAIYSDIERCLSSSNGTDSSPEQQQLILQVHHNLMVLGTFARGFDDVTISGGPVGRSASKPSIQELKGSTQVILVVLERLSKFQIIRDSARFAFSRLIPLLGTQILGEISTLIGALLNESKQEEFGDFLSFLGQLVHSYRQEDGVFEMFGSLAPPLIEKVFVFLNSDKSSTGGELDGSTDAFILKRDLRRQYLQFVFNVLNNGFGAIFLVGNNGSTTFGAVMESLFHYAGDLTDPNAEKLAIASLGKMMTIWGTGEIRADTTTPTVKAFAEGMKVPVFSDGQTILEQYSQACWTLPSKSGYDSKDAQIRLVLGELATLQKIVFEQKKDVYSSFLAGYLSRLGLPQNICQEYLTQLAQLKPKEFKKYFTDLVVRMSS